MAGRLSLADWMDLFRSGTILLEDYGVFLTQAYGMRHLTESLVALAPGLAFLLDRTTGRWFHLLTGVGFALVLWNLLLVLQFSFGSIPNDTGLGPHALVGSTWRFVQDDPATCLLLAEVLGILWLLLVWQQDPGVVNPAGFQQRDSVVPGVSPPHALIIGGPLTETIGVDHP